MTCTCCKPLSDAHRVSYTASLFGFDFPLRVEPLVFSTARRLATGYEGGSWEFYALSNGGFYMAPAGQGIFNVICENGFEGELSSDALGMTACLYAFSALSFGAGALAGTCAEQYHLLREHMFDHREVRSILAAID